MRVVFITWLFMNFLVCNVITWLRSQNDMALLYGMKPFVAVLVVEKSD